MLVWQLHYSWVRWKGALSIAYFTALFLASLLISPLGNHPQAAETPGDIHKIKHIVIIMEENRSYDSYFGAYPGGDGLPRSGNGFAVCVPNPQGGCAQPFHDAQDRNAGGPHGAANAMADIDGGKMDGLIAEQQRGGARHCVAAFDSRSGSGGHPDALRS